MLRGSITAVLVLILLAVLHYVAVNKLTERHFEMRNTAIEDQLSALPSPILRLLAFEYKGIVSDYLFIRGIVYIGGYVTGPSKGRFKLTDAQWQAFYNAMDVATDIDPYFQDPYYIANAFLTWDAGMVKETNALLDKGARYRDWDWTFPFFSGFNYFYFLQENEKAAEKLMEASRRSNNPVLASLASKLAFKANKTENSIAFLEEMLARTSDITTKRTYAMRIIAFKGMLVLEKAVEVHVKRFRKKPSTVEDLVAKGIIERVPQDPYGGTFFLDAQGTVRTTSEAQLMPYLKSKK